MKIKTSPDVIPGIYNFCDSRCNRCAFKKRCAMMGFMNHVNEGMLMEGTGIDYGQTVQVVSVGLHLNDLDEDRKMELTPEEEQEHEERRERIETLAFSHPLTKLAVKYRNVAYPLMADTLLEKFKEKTKEMRGLEKIGVLSRESVKSTMNAINENIETLMAFVLFMEMKITLALTGKMMDEEIHDDIGEQKYHDGVIKVVVLAIDQSVDAWKQISELIPDAEQDAWVVMGILDQLRKRCIKEFPDAMQFRRPGFDDEEPFPLLQ